MTFPALPPEVNVGRLMTGAGPAPATAAAASWSVIASAISARSIFLTTLLPRLAAAWQAPETALMTRNVAMYLAHNEGLRVQALLAATRHTKQAADYTAALAGMAQIPEITTNHVTNATLNATNFLGVNTGAIAANEAQYAGMWSQNATMMAVYLANSVANMTFEPFLPPKPMATPVSMPIAPAAAGAASVGDAVVTKLSLAAQGAAAVASTLWMRTAGTALTGVKGSQSMIMNAQRAQDESTTAAQNAEEKASERQTDAGKGKQLGQQLIQQMGTQGVQMGTQLVQTVVQLPQQAVQQVSQFGQGAMQPLSQLMSSIAQENRTEGNGYFGARPGSSTLETLAGGGTVTGAASALRSGGMVPFVAPHTWNTGGLAATPPPPPPAARPMMEPVRPMQPVGGNSPVARSTGKQRERIVIPDTAAVPVYVGEARELDGVPVDVPSGGQEG